MHVVAPFSLKALAAFLCCAFFLFPCLSYNQVVYVDAGSSCTVGCGASWAQAYPNLQDALSATDSGEIWVARGTYRPVECSPCTGTDREQSFPMKNNVALYGGFAGTEANREERDIQANPTILSGDIGLSSDSTDNAFRVLIAVNVDSTSILDGFIVEEGNADGPFGFSLGGGLYIDGRNGMAGAPIIRNCTFRNNYATGGGAIAMEGSGSGSIRTEISNCLFEGNTCSLLAISRGGAVYINGSVGATIEPRFLGCSFRNNFSGDDGGAMAINISSTVMLSRSYSAIQIDSCLFENNKTQGDFARGGAIWMLISANTESHNMIRNSRFINNLSGSHGGAVFNRASSALSQAGDRIINCFFSGNSSLQDGGALYFRGSEEAVNTSQAINCAFFRNQAAMNGGAVFSTSFSTTAGTTQNQLINCSFYGNSAEMEGGGMFIDGASGGINSMEATNCIFWGDSVGVAGKEILNNGGSVSLAHCIIEGGIPAGVNDEGNNLFEDPQYAAPQEGNLHLLPCSPGADAGLNAIFPPDITTDLDGTRRIQNMVIDIGAYENGRIFVDIDATGNNDGTSWEDAFTDLQDGLKAAYPGDQVWVAEGIYLPVTCSPCTDSDREKAFQLRNGVELYGGFAGVEDALEQRDYEAFPTILSGDIGMSGDSTDNAYRVVLLKNVSSKTLLDGFTIEEGNGDGPFGFFFGGGVYIDGRNGMAASPVVRNCIIRNNYATGGGGMAMEGSGSGAIRAEIRNCLFEGNTCSLQAISRGGAVYVAGSVGATIEPRFTGCTFLNNYSGDDGGAMVINISSENMLPSSYSAVRIDSCRFENNESVGDFGRGGAIWMLMSSNTVSNNVISNSQFINNIAGGNGGAIFNRASFDQVLANDRIINCFFSGNRSQRDGGALYFRGSQGAVNTGEAINCVFLDNQAALNGGAVYSTSFLTTGGTSRNRLANCSFYGNTAQLSGGGVYIHGSDGGVNEMTIQNSIFWEDSANLAGNEVYNGEGILSLSHCIIQDGYNGVGTQDAVQSIDPLYIAPDDGDLSLQPCSPAVNAGLNAFLPIDSFDLDSDLDSLEILDIDLAGLNRFYEGTTDLGALEWNGIPARLDSIEALVTGISCFGQCDGQLEAVPVGGQPAYSYLWSTGDTISTITGLCPDTYQVTVTDGYGCRDSMAFAVPDRAPLLANAGNDSFLCRGDSITLTASATGGDGDYDFSWSDNLGNMASVTAIPDGPAEYFVDVTDGQGCLDRDTVSILVIDNPEPAISGDTTFCQGQGTTLETGEYETYLWSTGEMANFIIIDQEGTYGVTVTDELGCTGEASLEVTSVETPMPQVSGNLFFCPGGSTTLDAGPYDFYLWSTGDFTQTITVNTEGSITVTVVNEEGCTGQGTVEVTERTEVAPQITGDLFICSGDITTLDAGDYESYIWSTGDTTQAIAVNRSGDFSVTVTDEFGCTGEATVEVEQGASVIPEITGELLICPDSTTTLDAGPYSAFQWSSGDTTQTITAGAEGVYTVIVTNEEGCTGQTSVLVEQEVSPMPEVTGQFTFCPGTFATLDAGPFDGYLWSTGDTVQVIEVDVEGAYSVTVTNEQGCPATTTADVVFIPSLMPQISGELTFCADSISTLDAGEFAGYLWSTGDTTRTIEVSTGGAYSVTVSDGRGCSGEASVVATQIEELMPQISGQLALCAGASTTLDAGDYAGYLWSTGDTTQAIEVGTGGVYSVTVFDGQGCSGEVSAMVSQVEDLMPQIGGQLALCAGSSTTLDAGEYAGYLWSTGDTTQTIEVSTSGAYSVTVFDGQDCSGEASAVVTQSEELLPQISGPLAFCAGGSTTLDAGGYAGYLWSTGDTTQIVDVSMGGTYSVTVFDEQGCSGEASAVVTQDSPPIAMIVAPLPAVCQGESMELIADGNGAFEWFDTSGTLVVTGPESVLVTPETTTGYYLFVSNVCGLDTAFIELSILSPPEVNVGPVPVLQAGEPYTLSASGASQYEWIPEAFLSCGDCPGPVVAADSSLTYLVIGTGENGCRDTARLLIEVLDKDAPLIDPVNTITPNGDGVNDFFVIPELAFYPDHKLSIFNRWGDVVYESRNYQGDWDGTYKGRELPAGTYLYVLVVEVSGEPYVIRKTITIIRE
ncbi:MAG: gliding motility-associated C-terminal domain-containing protein [Lewinellaceae bacterium]|nr:gliding motility-associated C-terminal domain-containing protein [Lewinellaceae bacterium]